jgi:inosine-uridine nucleoside N-ribohydrolase
MSFHAIALITLIALLAAIISLTGCSMNSHFTSGQSAHRRIPVILDTDIGDDIDDTWALTMLLKSPQFDVKLITTTHGQQDYRGRLIAKLLTINNRTDIPIGLGAGHSDRKQNIARWIEDFPLTSYRGKVFDDGVAALIDTVHRSAERSGQPVTIIAIGPLDTLAAALQRDPSIAAKANFVGMQGSVYIGYGNSNHAVPEFNVVTSIAASQTVFAAHWHSMAITPLDTCGDPHMKLTGDEFAAIKSAAGDPRVRAILENYSIWKNIPDPDQLTESTTLYDTVAVYLADPNGQPFLNFQTLHLTVSDQGVTAISPGGNPVRVATSWKDLPAYRQQLLHTLILP